VGLRVELCWDSSTVADIDLYLHTPYGSAPWYRPGSSGVIAGMDGTTCNGGNCTPELRFGLTRVDWGYPDSPVADCEAGPSTQAFRALGRCPNPRFGLDNNQQIASGISEIVQLDNPDDGQTFRIMVQNFDNQLAMPSVVVYCAGRIAAELAPPEWPPGFADPAPGGYGVMWRPVDVTTSVAPNGTTTNCAVRELTHPSRGGAYVTLDDASY
jgi:hypothetical protein